MIFLLNNQSADSVEKATNESLNIFKENLIVNTFYETALATKNVSFFNDLLDIYINLLKHKQPLSDDLLLVCVKYCRETTLNDSKYASKKQFSFTN